jgi:hypothetical protein
MSPAATQNVVPNEPASVSAPPCPVPACRDRTIANSAVPIAPPSRWMTLIALVPRGVSARLSAWKAAAMDGTTVAPTPAPTTSSAAERYRYEVPAPTWV